MKYSEYKRQLAEKIKEATDSKSSGITIAEMARQTKIPATSLRTFVSDATHPLGEEHMERLAEWLSKYARDLPKMTHTLPTQVAEGPPKKPYAGSTDTLGIITEGLRQLVLLLEAPDIADGAKVARLVLEIEFLHTQLQPLSKKVNDPAVKRLLERLNI